MPVARKRLNASRADVNPSTEKRSESGVREAQAAATRQALIDTARTLFTERGYHDVGIREFTAKAGLTRGALYHHFGDKESLFLAVFDAVERELIADSARGARPRASKDAWTQFRDGIQSYLDAAMRPDIQRITLVDGPAVLGWARWRKLEEGYSLGAITQALDAAMKGKLIRPQPVAPLTHLLLGSVMEAALHIAHSDNPKQSRLEVGRALDSLLRGLE
jgi:AcrR family transcriptional regulator